LYKILGDKKLGKIGGIRGKINWRNIGKMTKSEKFKKLEFELKNAVFGLFAT
jgi:hypothetical protein